MAFAFRRVVTARDEQGRSVVWEDRPLSPVELALFPGLEFYRVWATDGAEGALEQPGPEPDHSFLPPVGGSRWGVIVVPPEAASTRPPVAMEEAAADAEAKMPGLLSVLEPGSGGMHTTPTIDYDIVLAGELHLELDDGVMVRLTPGSCVVQRGTRHAWHNYGSEPAVLAYVLLGSG